MRILKKYAPPLLTLALILLGAAMPWLAGRIQDTYISKEFRESFDLNTVNLTMLQDAGVGPALRVIAEEAYSMHSWDGETSLTSQEVKEASMDAILQMDRAGLLPTGAANLLLKVPIAVSPSLIAGDDGSSLLVWLCIWEQNDYSPSYFLVVDDSSGKILRALVPTPNFHQNDEEIYLWLEKWYVFFQTYYDLELKGSDPPVKVSDGSYYQFRFTIWTDLKDGGEHCGLILRIGEDYTYFN